MASIWVVQGRVLKAPPPYALIDVSEVPYGRVKVERWILASLILVQYFRESSKKNSGDLMRSRTRENNVYVEGEEE